MKIATFKRNSPEKLNALTALRFFAAASIVLFHSFETFHFGKSVNSFFPTWQAVSFFFILSGFILTYVYKNLDHPGSVRRFFIARFARIWPLHCATLLLTLFIFSGWYWQQSIKPGSLESFWLPLVSNLFLVQSWIPLHEFIYSFNAVSWSISVEFVFYLLFPLLLVRIRYGWPVKLFLTFTLSIYIVYLLYMHRIDDNMEVLRFVLNSPLARLFEFTVGMFMAGLYSRIKVIYVPSRAVATVVEFAFLILVLVGMIMSLRWGDAISVYFGAPGKMWFVVGNSNVIFVALFILVMALARGRLSSFLSKRIFVFLGEISFSIYLLHQILLKVYSSYLEKFIELPIWVVCCYFIVLTFLGSYLLCETVEKPCQKLILSWGKSDGLVCLKKDLFNRRIGLLLSSIILLLIPLMRSMPSESRNHCACLKRSVSGASVVDAAQVESLAIGSIDGYKNINFGTKFRLRGVVIDFDKKQSLNLIWESLESVRLKYRVAIHFVDKRGKIISQADYNQSNCKNQMCRVKKGTFWIDTVALTNVPDNVKNIGVALFTERDMSLLPISDGFRDWNNTRLLVPLRANE